MENKEPTNKDNLDDKKQNTEPAEKSNTETTNSNVENTEKQNNNKTPMHLIKEDKTKRNRRLRVLAIILLVILIIVSLFYCHNTKPDNHNTSSTPSYSEDPNAEKNSSKSDNESAIVSALNEKVDKNKLEISMNTKPVFGSPTSEGNLNIINNQRNRYNMIVTIYKDDDNKQIYQSGILKPGFKIANAKLSTTLASSSKPYSCTAEFKAIDPQTNSEIGKVKAKISITVK